MNSLSVYVSACDFPRRRLRGELTREALPMEPGMPERRDYGYKRGGVANPHISTRRMRASSSSCCILRSRSNNVLVEHSKPRLSQPYCDNS